ncbi:MAG: hypothetical protein HXY51_15625 [Nitrospirae bacterium]|nr:hypothetical protein [Nitrospirota bacterium]
MDDRRILHWEYQAARGGVSAGFLLIAFATLSLTVAEGGTTPAADAGSESSEEATPDAESKEGKRRPLQSLLQGATPEEHERLQAERKRLSAAAKAFGTDPTAINGYYQLEYGHNSFTNNLRTDSLTAEARLPITPNLVVRVTMPYLFADLDQTRGFTTNGASDLTVRTGWRLYSTPNVALFIGTDTTFPTGSNDRLSTGKYTLGPAGAVAVPLPRMRSLFFTIVQDFNSVGGDPSRRDIHFMRVSSAVNTIWSDRWWTLASMEWDMDWNSNRKTTMNLLGEVGHRFDNHWNVFASSGAGVVGQDTFLGLDWTVQAGVRWMFQTPFFSEKVVEQLPMGGR